MRLGVYCAVRTIRCLLVEKHLSEDLKRSVGALQTRTHPQTEWKQRRLLTLLLAWPLRAVRSPRHNHLEFGVLRNREQKILSLAESSILDLGSTFL